MAVRASLDRYGLEGFFREMKKVYEEDIYQCEPGICVFIKNTEFDCSLRNLEGGDEDEATVKFTFGKLGFDVRVHSNLTAADLISMANRYSKIRHTGAFFLVISSHGAEGDIVYGSDGGTVAVHDLQKLFHATQCPSLAGIPKVFIIDACRGNDNEPVCSFPSKSAPPSPGVSVTSATTRDAVDIMRIFASTRGYTAGCRERYGSVLIQAFAQVIEEVPADKNLTGIMKKVQRKIQDPQTPQLESTFTKDYYIKSQGAPSNAIARRDAESRDVDAQREFELHREFHQRLTFGDGSMMATRMQNYTYRF